MVSTEIINLVTVHLLRCHDVAQRGLMVGLSAEDYPSQYRDWGIVWGLVRAHLERDGVSPTDLILTYDLAALHETGVLQNAEAYQRTLQIVQYAFSHPVESLQPAKMLLEDGPLQQMVDAFKLMPMVRQMSYVSDLEEMTTKLVEVHEARMATRVLQSAAVRQTFTAADRDALLGLPPVQPTGIEFIDTSRLGGLRPPCFIGLLAESSGGKTVFGIQIAIESVLRDRNTMFLAYEQAVQGDLAERMYRYALNISREEWKKATLEGMENAPQEFKDKLTKADKILSQLQLYDMSGAIPGQGTGGVNEIRCLLDQSKLQGQMPDVVVVDWLGPMVMAMSGQAFNWKRFKPESMADMIKFELQEIKNLVAAYKVKFILLHQLAPGIIGNKTPAYIPSWTDAAECKSFGQLMDYVFAFGRVDQATDVMWWAVPKARGSRKFHAPVKLDGGNDRILSAGEYTALEYGNSNTGYFMESSTRARGDEETFD